MYETDFVLLMDFLHSYETNPLLSSSDKQIIRSHKAFIDSLSKYSSKDLNALFCKEKKFDLSKILLTSNSHRFRLQLSKIITDYRKKQLHIEPSDPFLIDYNKNGVMLLNNFLPANEFEKLRTECCKYHKIDQQTGFMKFLGPREIILNKMADHGLVEIPKFIQNKTLNHILHILTGLEHGEYYYSNQSKIMFNYLDHIKGNDVQTEMHSDTFHPTFRWWLYLDDVTVEDGAFRYVKGSHNNTPDRIEWEDKMYKMVQGTKNLKSLGIGDRQGSFRVTDPTILKKAESMIGPKNTLLVADTHGFHQRGIIKPDHNRFCLFGYCRVNPFYINKLK